ncbi:MAG: S8 family serine peptidase, partial [Desulfovibrio sp.]|nr:S8 family serine peptidase [Desulfovibrio sp.]
AEKGNNAKSYSPKALLIANNQDGTISMSLGDYDGTFPMVSISLADAELIKDSAGSGTAGGYTYYTGTLSVGSGITHEIVSDNADVSSFSSWGVPGSLIMKPEISAPGGNIYSIYGTNNTGSGTAGGSDQYVVMSGTSMAAPHIAGLTGVLAQYVAENGITVPGHTTRQIIQSLLMSTAEPMHIEDGKGPYYPILQQGAGLANVANAIYASSVIFMGEDATASWADGKVKAELGDKPSKTGSYSYSFEIHNLADVAQTYELDTDLFTQDRFEYEDQVYMDTYTADLADYGWTVSYEYEGAAAESHDVDKNGLTEPEADAQAILDYLSGVKSAEEVDLSVADLDEDGQISSRDAYELLGWTPAAGEDSLTVPAGGSKTVTVTIHIPADTADFDAAYPSGAYVEGFTYVLPITETRDGALLDVVHSIPILGFYGSWTDPSMFDNMSYVDGLYGETRMPYSGKSDTNYLTVTYAGSAAKFSGNPYAVEDEFPADRLALSTGSSIGNVVYNLIRSAGTTGFAITKLDADHQVTDVLSASVAANDVVGQWYYESQQTWQNTGTKFYTANKALSSLGLSEGEHFRAGFYAIPEYNAMQINEDTTSADCGMLDNAGFRALLLENVLGKGAFVGYDFTVDNTAPTVSDASLSGSTLSVSASDNQNLAYVAVLSLDGETVYAEQTPGAPSAVITLDATAAINNAKGYVAVFAGDYAGNESAVAVKVNDNTYEEKTVYVLSDSLTAGKDYMIVSRNSAGGGYA